MPVRVPIRLQLVVPDILAEWPYSRAINPHYEECKAASEDWIRTFHAFGPKAQKVFDKCDFNRLAALAYPYASKERLRTACDLMNLFWVFDEYAEVYPEDAIHGMAESIMDALRNPHRPRPQNDPLVGEIARQFWLRALPTASASSQRRFIAAYEPYVHSLVQQARDRTAARVLSVEEYTHERMLTIGAIPAFALLQLDTDIPTSIITSPQINLLEQSACEMIFLTNDLYSWNVEQARGEDEHNIVSVVMHELGTDAQGAFDWVGRRFGVLAKRFLGAASSVVTAPPPIEPSFTTETSLDAEVAQYVEGLANWVRAGECWCFETERYFGRKAAEVQRTRRVELLPRA